MLSVAVAKDQVAVEPGNAVTLNFNTHNEGESAGRFEIEVDGLDPEWVALPTAAFTLGPGEERTHKVLLKPPRSSESKAGSYPFVLRCRSLDSGEGADVQAVLEVEPFSLISLEISPKRGTAKYIGKEEQFAVTAINLGNVDQNLQLFADDPEDACTYQFSSDRVMLSPGGQKALDLKVHPSSFPIVGAPRLYGFGVSARGVENPHVSANVQAQVERRSLITPSVLLLWLVILILAAGWWAMRPKPPKMNSFSTDSTVVYFGQTISLKWTAEGADTTVLIESDKNDSFPNLDKSGSLDVQINTPVTYFAYAVSRTGAKSDPLIVKINPQQPPSVPMPKVENFSVDKRNVKLGEAITIEYSASNAERIVLQPTGEALPLNMNSYKLAMTQPGSHEFSIIAYNKINQAAQSKSITITVSEPSEASVISFQALLAGQPLGDQEVDQGTLVSLEWQVSGASRVEISGLGELPELEKGTVDVSPQKTTSYTLTVKDSKGRASSSKVTIKVKAPPPSSDPKAPPPH
ncbi:MAG: hypothetical protein U0R49_12770 [Fimbriimonadales bacterium]